MIHRGRRWIMRFDLSDDEWALLEPLMPKSRMSARSDDRKIMNAIFYVLRTGMPWRDLLYLIDSTFVKTHRSASGAGGGSKIRRSASVAAVAPRKSEQPFQRGMTI